MISDTIEHEPPREGLVDLRLMTARVAAAIDAAVDGSQWSRVDTFAECRSRTVRTMRLGVHYETITGSETGAHTRLATADGSTLSITATGSPRDVVEDSLDQLRRSLVVHHARSGTAMYYLGSGNSLLAGTAEHSHPVLTEGGLADFADMVLGAYAGVAGLLTFSELNREIACEDGKTLVSDRQVRRRLHLEVSTPDGGVGEDGIILLNPEDISDRSITEPVFARALRRARNSHRRVPSPNGRLPVLFSGAAAGVLIHELVGHLLETDIIAAGGTALADRLGSQVCDMPLTIVDDPTLTGRWGSFRYDDEGRLAVPTPLLMGGVVCGVLTDRTRGSVTAAEYCGNSARRSSYEYVPLPRMSNLSVSVGSNRLDDVIADLHDAIYCDELTRGQVDPATGRFTLNMSSGKAIRSGRMCEYLAPAILTGNVLEVLASIRAVCDNLDDIQTLCGKSGQQVLVEMNAPSLLVTALEVTSS